MSPVGDGITVGGVQFEFQINNKPDWWHEERWRAFLSSPCKGSVNRFEIEFTPVSGVSTLDLSEVKERWLADLKLGNTSFIMPGDPHIFESFLRVVTAEAVLKAGGLLLHGCGVMVAGLAIAGCGISGSGKSTLAAFGDPGSVLTDELVLIRRDQKIWTADATPFWGSMPYRRPSLSTAPLRAVALLKKSSINQIHVVSQGQMIKDILKNVVIYHSTVETVSRALETVLRLVEEVPCVEWEFPNQAQAWRVWDEIPQKS